LIKKNNKKFESGKLIRCQCTWCNLAIEFKRAKFMGKKFKTKNNFCNFNKLELIYKLEEDSYNKYFAEYLNIPFNSVNHFLEKFYIENFNYFIKDEIVPIIDSIKIEKKLRLENEMREIEMKEIEESNSKSNLINYNNTNFEKENTLIDNFIIISEYNITKFYDSMTNIGSEDIEKTIMKTYEIINYEENL